MAQFIGLHLRTYYALDVIGASPFFESAPSEQMLCALNSVLSYCHSYVISIVISVIHNSSFQMFSFCWTTLVPSNQRSVVLGAFFVH